ncbi:hypothetical protein ACIBF1_42715 [Spirillospora sp. NPDC050679]
MTERPRTEPEPFSVISDRYHGPIHRYAAALLGPAAAEVITADTFLAASDQRHRYDSALHRHHLTRRSSCCTA